MPTPSSACRGRARARAWARRSARAASVRRRAAHRQPAVLAVERVGVAHAKPAARDSPERPGAAREAGRALEVDLAAADRERHRDLPGDRPAPEEEPEGPAEAAVRELAHDRDGAAPERAAADLAAVLDRARRGGLDAARRGLEPHPAALAPAAPAG